VHAPTFVKGNRFNSRYTWSEFPPPPYPGLEWRDFKTASETVSTAADMNVGSTLKMTACRKNL
jgi:hypothetical protein